ncbi:STAS domain-containing protein [Halocynthiibacter sp.]|uniref:STAS domain-containing protein n=1 Tax=Halocynthiibacter sp. TaxID=1979210 RepID=UPI003C5721E6
MSSTHTVTLPPRLGLGEVKSLIDELRKSSKQDTIVDAAAVTHLGTLCLQALIAGARAHIANGTTFQFSNQGETFQQQLELFGLSSEQVQGGHE